MQFEPDIIVTSADPTEVALVVEVKQRLSQPAFAERQMKRYMLGMRCPLGLLVTPDRMWLLRDRFRSDSEDSIERVGEFSTPGSLRSHVKDKEASGFELEQAVQNWLKALGRGSTTETLDPKLREALEEYVVPALAQGVIRAGGPRILTGSR